MNQDDRPRKAMVQVFERGIGEPRVFEVPIDGLYGVTAKQLSGPPLGGKLVVSELHFGVSGPGHSQDYRTCMVRLETDGKRVPLEELYENEVELFRRTAEPGERAYFVTIEPV